MVESFQQMIMSPDKSDIQFAMDILDNRDKDDIESEKNFKAISTNIVSNDLLFPKDKSWIIRANGNIMVVNGKAAFRSQTDAESTLSRHLTKWIGISKSSLTSREKWYIISKEKSHINMYLKDPIKYSHCKFDETDKQAYIDELMSDKNKLGTRALWGSGKDNVAYFEAIRKFFKGGRELRDFLVKNGIVKIELL